MNRFQLVIAGGIEATTARRAELEQSLPAATASRTSAWARAEYCGTGR
jgi:hypothetical protein